MIVFGVARRARVIAPVAETGFALSVVQGPVATVAVSKSKFAPRKDAERGRCNTEWARMSRDSRAATLPRPGRATAPIMPQRMPLRNDRIGVRRQWPGKRVPKESLPHPYPPFTAPAVRPAMIWRCAITVRTRTGSVTMSAAAASGPQLSCSKDSML